MHVLQSLHRRKGFFFRGKALHAQGHPQINRRVLSHQAMQRQTGKLCLLKSAPCGWIDAMVLFLFLNIR
jgi:hypothetical protein